MRSIQAICHIQEEAEVEIRALWQQLTQSTQALNSTRPLWVSMPLPKELLHKISGGYDRGFWSVRQHTGFLGFWEKQVLCDWLNIAPENPYYVRERFKTEFRMYPSTVKALPDEYGHLLGKQTTRMRETIPSDKRMAIALNYLCCGSTYHEMAAKYDASSSICHGIVHDFIEVLHQNMVPKEIVFPKGNEINRVMAEFETLCNLTQCAGAMDGTFFHMKSL